jgi:hypothetical protein
LELFEEDIIRFFKELARFRVRYIIVGGMAVNYHGFARATGDIDIWIDISEENRENFVNALTAYGIEGAGIFYELPFTHGHAEIALDNGTNIDLMSDLQFFGRDKFAECLKSAHSFNLTEDVEVKILHINHLIEEKERSARPKDNLDAAALKKLYST